MNGRHRLLALPLVATLGAWSAAAPIRSPDPAPQAPGTGAVLLKEAKAAAQKRDYEAAAAAYQRALDADPANADAHTAFMGAVRSAEYARAGMDKATTTAERRVAIYAATAASRERLVAIYEEWARRHPSVAAVQWGLGRQFADEPARAEACYLKAAALDPGFAPAWVELGRMAEMRDDRPGARDFFRKAADADPSNDYNRYLFVNALKAIDRAAFVAAVDDLIVRFPDSQWSARALLTVAQIAPTLEVRAAVLERHLARFPSQAASSGSARDLYDVYLAIGPDRALALARRTAAQAKGESLAQAWTARTALAERVVAARDLLSNGKATEAGRLLQAVAVPPGVDPTPMVLLRAEAAERAGDAPAAYARLIDAAAEWPAARVETALVRLGERRGRSAAEVDRDVWAARERTAKVLEPFELDRLDAPTRVRLADHAGQVVLVNFWFPT